jgi:hypothetical protein
MDAFELLDKVKAFDVEQAVEVAFSSDAFLRSVESEQVKQMRAGKNADGKRIGKYRNKAYARKKNEMNPEPGLGNVDLILTGEFSRNIFAQSDGGVMEIASNDSKSPMLEEKYGESIFGLSDKFKETPASILQTELNNEIKNELGL